MSPPTVSLFRTFTLRFLIEAQCAWLLSVLSEVAQLGVLIGTTRSTTCGTASQSTVWETKKSAAHQYDRPLLDGLNALLLAG